MSFVMKLTQKQLRNLVENVINEVGDVFSRGEKVRVGEGDFALEATIEEAIPGQLHGLYGYKVRIPETVITVKPHHVKRGRS